MVLAPVADGQGASSPLLTGEVTALETDYDGTGTFTVIRGYDLGHRLMRQRRVAAYRNQTAADIVRKVVGMNGIRVGKGKGDIQPTKTVYEFISQANVTDWDFLARLADENKMVMSLDSKGRIPVRQARPGVPGALDEHARREEPLRPPGRRRHAALPGRDHLRRPGRQDRGARLERHRQEEARR